MSITAIEPSTRVRVYLNIHKTRAAGHPVYSIKDKRSGLVVGHADHIVLADAAFVVSEAGRQRVLREGRKNVHAFVEGVLADGEHPEGGWTAITYNPLKYTSFVDVDTMQPVRSADLVELRQRVRAHGIKGGQA
jgi:hypothetical protein